MGHVTTGGERLTRRQVESAWYQDRLGQTSLGVYIKMHRAVFDVLTPSSAEKRRRTARHDRFAEPGWVHLYRALPSRSILDDEQTERLRSVLDEVGPVVVHAAMARSAHFTEVWQRIQADSSGQLATTREKWRTIFDTRLGTSVGEVILATPDLEGANAADIVQDAASLLYDAFRSEIRSTSSDVDWIFASPDGESPPSTVQDPLQQLDPIEHRHERAILRLRDPSGRRWALARCIHACGTADAQYQAACPGQEVQAPSDAPDPLATLLTLVRAGPRWAAPRDTGELVRYVTTVRYPLFWTRVDPDFEAQMTSLLQWLDRTPPLLRNLEASHGSIAADEARQKTEDKIDRALARDYVREKRPPPRTHAYWHRTLTSARDDVVTRLGAGRGPGPLPSPTGSSTGDAYDPYDGAIEPVDHDGVDSLLWLIDIERAAVDRLDTMVESGQLVFSGDAAAITGLARWWLRQRAADALLRLAEGSNVFGSTTSTGRVVDWAEQIAAAATAAVSVKARGKSVSSAGPEPRGTVPTEGEHAEVEDQTALVAREAAAAAVHALQVALMAWKDGG